MVGIADEGLEQDVVESHHPNVFCPEAENRPCFCRFWNRSAHSCRDHWKEWADRRYKVWKFRLKRAGIESFTWHHVVLHYRERPDEKRRARMVASWLGSITRKYPGAVYFRAFHHKHGHLHVHLLLGTRVEIDADWAYDRWRRIMGKYGTAPYAPRDAFCQPRKYPKSVLRYFLGINENHPRDKRPWGPLAGKVAYTNVLRDGSRRGQPRCR